MTLLQKLLEKLKQLQRLPEPFDPATLEDPVAMLTEWGPAAGGGTNFQTHRLVVVSPERIEFRAAIGAVLFSLLFLFVGLAVAAGFVAAALLEEGDQFEWVQLLPALIGVLFTLVGAGLLYFYRQPIVFDRRHEAFWKGRTAPNEIVNTDSLKHYARFNDIHALQIITEHVSGNKSSYYSYELNLVLKDGRRLTVVDHGDQARILQDADTLAQFLAVPVWNASRSMSSE